MFLKTQFMKLLVIVLAVVSATWTSNASASAGDPGTNNLGTWLYEFRLCVQSGLDAGLPLEEARSSCAYLLRLDSAPTFTSPSAPPPETETFGTWLYEFRLCVQSGLDAGLPLEEARSSCSSLSEPPAQ